jgi:uncharacterized protein YjiS (DUF1127 family)
MAHEVLPVAFKPHRFDGLSCRPPTARRGVDFGALSGMAASCTQRRGLGGTLSMLAARWHRTAMLRRARRQVAEIDDDMLADIGVSRAQAMFEIDRAIRDWRS